MTWPQHQKLLQFWSGSPVPPINGFGDETQNVETCDTWTITGCDYKPGILPKASTWFVTQKKKSWLFVVFFLSSFLLMLPFYQSEDELQQSVLKAVEFGCIGYDEDAL